jgi:hypothetical protein
MRLNSDLLSLIGYVSPDFTMLQKSGVGPVNPLQEKRKRWKASSIGLSRDTEMKIIVITPHRQIEGSKKSSR